MELLTIWMVLVILHFPFYGMEPNPDHALAVMPSDVGNCGSDGGSKPIKPGSCGRSSPCNASMMSGNENSRLKAMKLAYESAEVAKAANEAQAGAAQNASRQVKLMLAEKAMAAARTAESVLEGKQAIVDNLAREIRDADAAVGQIKASLETSRENVVAAGAAAKLADHNVAVMQELVDQLKSSLADLDALSEQSNADLQEKNKIMAKAKARGDRLAKQFAQAKAEYEKVKVAACRAVSAAVEAKNPKQLSQGDQVMPQATAAAKTVDKMLNEMRSSTPTRSSVHNDKCHL